MKNLGFVFYKDYFKNLEFNRSENRDFVPQLNEMGTKNLINDLFNSNTTNYNSSVIDIANECFELTTIYPGLLIGSGYNHEIGDQKNELKLGFFFDHTTGLPCIPGSSVKGVLRDACEKVNGKYALSIIEELSSGERIAQKDKNKDSIWKIAEEFFEKNQAHFNPIDTTKPLSKKNPSHFINWVFNGMGKDGKNLPLNQRDIFFDSFPVGSKNDGGKLLANDYITHHENPLKNPNPVQFLKVLPQVVFRFDFKLTESNGIKKELKLELFRQVLLDLGVGAKTNVGYGRFK